MTTSDKIFYKYGYPPFLRLLQYYEVREDFDVCAAMYDTIKRVNANLGGDAFPTRYDPENTVNDFLESETLIRDKEGYRLRFEDYFKEALEFSENNRPQLILNI